MNFIIEFSKCLKHEESYEHIMIVVNKFFKKKIRNFEFVKNRNCNSSIFEINITRKRIIQKS